MHAHNASSKNVTACRADVAYFMWNKEIACDKKLDVINIFSLKNSFISQFSENGLFSAKLDKLCNFNGRPNYGKTGFLFFETYSTRRISLGEK